MDCKEFQERLDLYVDGELPPVAADGAREHLKGCAPCARSEAGLRHLKSSLKRVVDRHRPPAGLERNVLDALRARGRDTSKRAGRSPDESVRGGTPVWRAKVVVPAPLLALLLLTVVALAGWLAFARGHGRRAGAPPGEASRGTYFSGYYSGERASIQVVPRASRDGAAR